jgi:hypothetical protein
MQFAVGLGGWPRRLEVVVTSPARDGVTWTPLLEVGEDMLGNVLVDVYVDGSCSGFEVIDLERAVEFA